MTFRQLQPYKNQIKNTNSLTGSVLAYLISKLEEQWEKQRKGINLPICYETRTVTKNGKVIPVEVAVAFGK